MRTNKFRYQSYFFGFHDMNCPVKQHAVNDLFIIRYDFLISYYSLVVYRYKIIIMLLMEYLQWFCFLLNISIHLNRSLTVKYKKIDR